MATAPTHGLFPRYSVGERWADACVHAVGVAASLAAVAFLFALAIHDLRPLWLVSLVPYGAGLIAMFGLSAGYNLVDRPERKEVLRRLDHAAIFVMIAGTYTPIALNAIGGPGGHALLGIVWTLAAVGIAVKLLAARRFERLSIALYLTQGWMVLLALEPLRSTLSAPTLALLGIGGALYSLGVVFHLWRALPYQNAIWHAFVLAAASCHYLAVLEILSQADHRI